MSNLLTTAIDVEGYLQNNSELHSLFPFGVKLSISELSLGYVNKLFVIEAQNRQNLSYVLKQTLPYMRHIGSNWPLDTTRFNVELHCLLYYGEILPNFSPKIYYYDNNRQIMIMEYLKGYVGLGEHLDSYLLLPNLAENISTFLSSALFFTSDYYLTSDAKKRLQSKLANPSIETISENLVFTNPYMDFLGNQWNPSLTHHVVQIRSDSRIKKEVATLKDKFVNSPQTLLHGDFHQDSILSNSKDIKVIDPEFALWGPAGYDVGLIFCTLILTYLCLLGKHKEKTIQVMEYQKFLLDTICEIWHGFSGKFINLWISNNNGHLIPNSYWEFPEGAKAFAEYRNKYMLQILKDACGFAGCRILAGLMGFITFRNISSINNEDLRSEIEMTAFRIGERLILEHNHIRNVNGLIAIIQSEANF